MSVSTERTTGYEIPVTMGSKLRSGTRLVIGVMEAGALVDRYVIPRRDFRTKAGYQREVSNARVNQLVRDLLAKRVDLPTSLLLNLRGYEAGVHLVERDGREFLRLADEKLYVVDGQHRVEGLRRLVETEPERWSAFGISFVCMLGAEEREEMEQFYVVNSTAKSVRTDLALDLLKQRAEHSQGVMDALIERGQAWKVKAQTLAEGIESQPLWRGRIRFPGVPKGDTIIASAGMVSSLKGLLDTPYFGGITTENQLKILNAYWRAIHEVIPEVFVDPKAYALQKGTGVMAMHSILVSLLEYLRSKGESTIETESYIAPLSEMLPTLQGDTTSGDVAQGADFWKTGPDGAAGAFSSNAGRRVLVSRLRAALPAIEVE